MPVWPNLGKPSIFALFCIVMSCQTNRQLTTILCKKVNGLIDCLSKKEQNKFHFASYLY